jgi:hypothetical protein
MATFRCGLCGRVSKTSACRCFMDRSDIKGSAMNSDMFFKSAIDGNVIGTGREQIELLLHDRNRLLLAIDYWSHCMSEGMRATCPEKCDELASFLISCKVAPWYIPKMTE